MLDTSNYLSYLGIYVCIIAPAKKCPHRQFTDILLIFEWVFFAVMGGRLHVIACHVIVSLLR